MWIFTRVIVDINGHSSEAPFHTIILVLLVLTENVIMLKSQTSKPYVNIYLAALSTELYLTLIQFAYCSNAYDDWRRIATDRKVVSHWEFSKRPPISEKLRTPTFKTKANFLKIVIDSSTSYLLLSVELLDKYLIYVDTSWKGQSNGNFAWKVITQVRKGQNSYVPSFFMLTWRHFLNRQDWHWFRRVTSTTQLPFSLQT